MNIYKLQDTYFRLQTLEIMNTHLFKSLCLALWNAINIPQFYMSLIEHIFAENLWYTRLLKVNNGHNTNNEGQYFCPHRPKWTEFYKLMNIMSIPESESIGNISSIIGETMIETRISKTDMSSWFLPNFWNLMSCVCISYNEWVYWLMV